MLRRVLTWLIELATGVGAIGEGINLWNLPASQTRIDPHLAGGISISIGFLILILSFAARLRSMWSWTRLRSRPQMSDASAQQISRLASTPGLTTAEVQRLLKPHLGTWLSIKGEVRDVIQFTDRVHVLLRNIDGDPKLGGTANFREEQDRAARLCQFHSLGVKGVVEGAAPDFIKLDKARFV